MLIAPGMCPPRIARISSPANSWGVRASMICTSGLFSRAKDLFDAVCCDEILGILVAQDARRIANIDGTRDMPSGISISWAHVPHDGVACDGLSDIIVIHDDRGRGHCGVGR